MMKFNLNDRVKVRLSDQGRDALSFPPQTAAHERLRKADSLVYEEMRRLHVAALDSGERRSKWRMPGEWLEFQLWELMTYFGPSIVFGYPGPFEENAIVFLSEGNPGD